MQLKRHFQFQFLVTEKRGNMFVCANIYDIHICHRFAFSTQSPIILLLKTPCYTVKKFDEVVRHLHRETQDQFRPDVEKKIPASLKTILI
jgi:hypothetical protein